MRFIWRKTIVGQLQFLIKLDNFHLHAFDWDFLSLSQPLYTTVLKLEVSKGMIDNCQFVLSFHQLLIVCGHIVAVIFNDFFNLGQEKTVEFL